ncbi:hypothetical protein BG000_011853, partial [Podila horticola]
MLDTDADMVIHKSALRSIESLKERVPTQTLARASPVPKPKSTLAPKSPALVAVRNKEKKTVANNSTMISTTETTRIWFSDTYQAESAICNLRQTDTMAGYISQLQALAAQTEWNDAALLAFFKWGLSPEVRELMSSDGKSSTNLAEAQLQATLAYQKLLIQRQALLSNNISLRSNEHTSSIVHNPPPACVFPVVPVSHVFKDQNRSPQPHKLAPEERQ